MIEYAKFSCQRGSTVEQVICNHWVAGSIPVAGSLENMRPGPCGPGLCHKRGARAIAGIRCGTQVATHRIRLRVRSRGRQEDVQVDGRVDARHGARVGVLPHTEDEGRLRGCRAVGGKPHLAPT